MPFFLIKGRFKPLVGNPDGDSVRFLADDKNLWSKLEGTHVRLGTSVKSKDTAQLRFEGIDAIEKAATKPLATDAKKNMLKLIGFSQNNPEPAGYILTRMTDDKSGRPIAFVLTGTTPKKDGSVIHLEGKMLQDSVNYQQMKDGYA
jgi:hypothetical protein